MPADAQLEITDLVTRFVAESDRERELAADADLVRGLAWGEDASVTLRRVGLHLASIPADRRLPVDA